jgi:hypothetical protein
VHIDIAIGAEATPPPITLVLAGPDDHPPKEIKEEVSQLQAA